MKERPIKIESAADGAVEPEELGRSKSYASRTTVSKLSTNLSALKNPPIWLEWILVFSLAAVALLLRRKGLSTQSLWFDEADLLARSQAGLGEILQSFARPGENGPLYTLFIHFWTQLAGSGAGALRTPSMLAGTAAVPMLYLVGKRLYGIWFGLLAALLLTISPYNIWYSQDAKMYPLALLLTLTSVYLFLIALEKGDRQVGWWIGYVLVTTASYYVHLMAVLIVPVEILFYWFSRPNRQQPNPKRRRAVIAMALLTLPYVPIAVWQVVALGKGSLGQTWFQPVGLLDMLDSLGRRFSVNRSLPSEPWESLGSLVFALLVAGALLTLWYPIITGWWNAKRHNPINQVSSSPTVISPTRKLAIFLTLYLVLPVGAFYLLTTRIPLYADRYLLIASPAYYLLTAFALLKLFQARRVWLKFGGVAAGVAIIALVGVSLRTYNYSTEPQKEDWRGAMQWLTQHVEPGDSVFVIPGYLNSAVDYYFKPQAGVDVYTLPSDLLDDHNDPATNSFLLTSIFDHKRAWLVVSPERYAHDEPKELVQKNWFNYNTTMFVDPAKFVGVAIYGYSFRQIPGTNQDFFPRSAVTNYNFGGKLKLEGYDVMPNGAGTHANLPAGQVHQGDYLHLTFYWRKLLEANPQANYQITVQLLDAKGNDTRTDYTAQPLNGYFPYSSWREGEAFRDFRDLYIHVAPGKYQIRVSVAPVANPGNYLSVSGDEDGQQKENLSGIILSKEITVLP